MRPRTANLLHECIDCWAWQPVEDQPLELALWAAGALVAIKQVVTVP